MMYSHPHLRLQSLVCRETDQGRYMAHLLSYQHPKRVFNNHSIPLAVTSRLHLLQPIKIL